MRSDKKVAFFKKFTKCSIYSCSEFNTTSGVTDSRVSDTLLVDGQAGAVRDRNNCCKVYEGLIDPMQASRKLPGSFHCELDIIRYCIARTRRGAPVRL